MPMAQIQSLMDLTDRVRGCVSERDLGKSPGGVGVDLGFGDVKYKYEESQDVPESGVSDHEKVVGRLCKHSISGFF